MKLMNVLVILFGIIANTSYLQAQNTALPENKEAVVKIIENHRNELIRASDNIWAYAETAFEEYKSSKELADLAGKHGFTVEMGIAGMPTAFTAEYGSGSPVIGILGEFDALPGISQKTQPTKEPLKPGAAGHGCGHNLFGVASLGAAIAIKELIEDGELNGTIRFYGTPAEERFFGKLCIAREGYFDDLDICMDWHPSAKTESAVQSSLALVDFTVEFFGQAAHASSDPWNGRSAVDGLELYTTGINYLREHVKPTVRIHYQIQESGDVANVVPDYSKIWVRVRDTKRDGMQEVYERVMEMAEGAAIMANVDHSIQLISGIHEILVNRTGGAVMQKNLELLGSIEYTGEEQEYAKIIQQQTGKPETGLDASISELKETAEHPQGGSTDVGDVSWLVPVIRLAVTMAPVDTPWHSWAVVACGGMSIGHKALVYAAKALAMTMVDLYENEELRKDIKNEFTEKKGDYEYQGMVPPGPPPIPEK